MSSETFFVRWADADEISSTPTFWLAIIREVLGFEPPEKYIDFQKRVMLSHISFIDAYIPSTGIIIEQKSSSIDLDKPQQQSDGSILTPYQQAKRYYNELPFSERGRYIITSNFRQIRIHDLEHPHNPPTVILLEELEQKKDSLAFLVLSDKEYYRERDISLQAGELVSKLYDALESSYKGDDPKFTLNKHMRESINIFCVRIVFLLYAEDAGLLSKSQFHDYLQARIHNVRESLLLLFNVLSQKQDERDPYMDSDLLAFPYINGGLFEEQHITLPRFNSQITSTILREMSEGFNWKDISPTIFGALFESTLNDETRKLGGMHYTSLENIHKVIDPLFLDQLGRELTNILDIPDNIQRTIMLRNFRTKLTSIRILDPACGSGNFLTESYLSLCRLELSVIDALGDSSPLSVSVSQFSGIECNDFAVRVARTALWISEAQMKDKSHEQKLPLKHYGNIHELDALTTDWHEIVTPSANLYIVGNPPYMGYSGQTRAQKDALTALGCSPKVDYVAGWYHKASGFMKGTEARAAFVSTNSITQGEQVSMVFKPLYEMGINIDFAHTSFVWDNEADEKAKVHVVVIGFDACEARVRRLYTEGGIIESPNINFYLAAAPTVFAEARAEPLSADAPRMILGNMARDDGNLMMTLEERAELIAKYPAVGKLIRPFMGAREFINRKPRYCLWLAGASPKDFVHCKPVMERVGRVKEFRLASKKAETRKLAETPTLFAEIRPSDSEYIAVPRHSSEKRKYVPIGWLPAEVIPGDAMFMIPNAGLYHFGIITSRAHMAWMRMVCGRLREDYRYSNTVVYNTFVWPGATVKQRERIEACAQGILDARGLYPECTFGELYNDDAMPVELRRAHERNDEAVMRAYGWDAGMSDDEVVGRLFELYGEAVKG